MAGNRYLRTFCVFLVSAALAAAVALICVRFREEIPDFVLWCVLYTVWSFCIIPAYIYGIKLLDEKFNFQQAFWLGYVLGGLFLLLPLLIAPLFAAGFYLDFFITNNNS